MKIKTDYQHEWAILQRSYDQYEAYGLILKIIAIVLFFASFSLDTPPIVATIVLLILWLQEGIWKTFQSRTEQRLLLIEAQLPNSETVESEVIDLDITDNSNQSAFQFYTQWENKRPSTLVLIQAYVKQSLRPTVAYPYVILVLLSLFINVL